ncbi:MAG: WGR domain-containing protein [Cyanobacteria bacterium J06648_11]
MQTVLDRVDPKRNMARFYAVEIRRDLFGTWTVTRRWGRIGKSGREAIESYPKHEAAVAAAHSLIDRKVGRGYRPRLS